MTLVLACFLKLNRSVKKKKTADFYCTVCWLLKWKSVFSFICTLLFLSPKKKKNDNSQQQQQQQGLFAL